MKDYSPFVVKDYTHWTVLVHENQSYLGRLVVWCKRADVLDLADATPEERDELFLILSIIRNAATEIFKPDWFNYAFLGNETRHLHGHFIPRYASERTFDDFVFRDERWGYNYQTDHNFITPPTTLEKIRNTYRERLR